MMDSSLPTHEDQLRLLRAAKNGSESAREELILRNAGLVKSIAKKFIGRGVDFDDLMQLGYIGLYKSVCNFDESYGVRFSTYAVPLILGEIRRFLRDNGMVKVSRSLVELRSKALACSSMLAEKLGRDPSMEEISCELGVSVDEVLLALESGQQTVSLNEPVFDDGEKGVRFVDTLADRDDSAQNIEMIMLKDMISKLETRERQLMVLRYFLDKTQTETAKALGISQVQVSRLEAKVLTKLRKKNI